MADPFDPRRQTAITTQDKNERFMAMLCHLLGLAVLTGIPIGNIIGPLIPWLMKKEEMPFVDHQGKEAINFQITMTIAGAICIVLMFVFVGIILLAALFIYDVIVIVKAANSANKGIAYHYPTTIRFLT
jgi:hypothetical protein